jgi:tRNA A37 threonylcarbamoyladenosine modification protein TsaB
VAAIDARRGELFVFARDIATGAPLLASQAATAADIVAALTRGKPPFVLNGSRAPALAALLPRATVVGTADHAAVADVAELAFRAEAHGPPRPLYLRDAGATPQAGAIVARL